jgi:Ca2+-binding EF-hand superfamily protein
MNLSVSSFGGAQRPDFSQMREMMFKKADADDSGGINKDELTTMISQAPSGIGGIPKPSAEDMFAKLDGDGDGEISQSEHEEGMQVMMEKFQKMTGSFSGSSDMFDTLLKKLRESDEKQSQATGQSSLDQFISQFKSQDTTTNLFEAKA